MIAIHGQPFGGEEILARHLAAQHGLQCVERQVIVEKAAARGVPHAELWQVLKKPPQLFGRFSNRRRMLLTLLECGLAEEIRPGQSVCYGWLAELLPRNTPFVLRIGIRASREFRAAQVRERLRLTETEALELIKQIGRDRRIWVRSPHGIVRPSETAEDLAIEFDRVSIDDVFEKVDRQVRTRLRHTSEGSSTGAWSNHVLSCRVKAALALAPSTAHVEIHAPCDDGLVELRGRLPWTVDLHEVERVIRKVPGVNDVIVDGLRPTSAEGLSLHGALPTSRPVQKSAAAWNGRFAAASALCLALILTLAINGMMSPVVDGVAVSLGAEEEWFVGYITDTLCRDKAGMEPECIRRCVNRYPDVQYALSDGEDLFPLSDRSTPAKYAAQFVRVIGRLDEASGVIQVKSIQPAPAKSASYRVPAEAGRAKGTM
jgi:cytidylate kinase